MHEGNLTGRDGSIKRMGMAAVKTVVAVALMAVVACSKDPTTVVDETFDYSGTYVATYATETLDDATIFNYGGSAISGLLIIRDTTYAISVGFDTDLGYVGRYDQGRLIINDGYIDFQPDADTVLMSTARGFYDVETDRIRVNYIRGDALWTEYWKAASPVIDVDTTTHVPF